MGARNFRNFLAKCPKFHKNFLATLLIVAIGNTKLFLYELLKAQEKFRLIFILPQLYQAKQVKVGNTGFRSLHFQLWW